MEVTLTIRVESEEDFGVLRALMDVLEHNKGLQIRAQDARGHLWSEEAFLRLWEDVSEQAREVMREIATQPEGYPRDSLLAKLNTTGAELGRCMSSIGHHIERVDSYSKYQRPIVHDWEGDIYMMPEDVAQLIQRLKL